MGKRRTGGCQQASLLWMFAVFATEDSHSTGLILADGAAGSPQHCIFSLGLEMLLW